MFMLFSKRNYTNLLSLISSPRSQEEARDFLERENLIQLPPGVVPPAGSNSTALGSSFPSSASCSPGPGSGTEGGARTGGQDHGVPQQVRAIALVSH